MSILKLNLVNRLQDHLIKLSLKIRIVQEILNPERVKQMKSLRQYYNLEFQTETHKSSLLSKMDKRQNRSFTVKVVTLMLINLFVFYPCSL